MTFPQINSIMERETEIAKLHLTTGQRDLALLALRKKKYQESLLESTATQLINIEQQVHPPPRASRGRST